jgi:hypothetical protein
VDIPAAESTERKRKVPRDSWGMLQRVYGLRKILLWPGQFALLDLFKVITVLCLIGSGCTMLFRLWIFWFK